MKGEICKSNSRKAWSRQYDQENFIHDYFIRDGS